MGTSPGGKSLHPGNRRWGARPRLGVHDLDLADLLVGQEALAATAGAWASSDPGAGRYVLVRRDRRLVVVGWYDDALGGLDLVTAVRVAADRTLAPVTDPRSLGIERRARALHTVVRGPAADLVAELQRIGPVRTLVERVGDLLVVAVLPTELSIGLVVGPAGVWTVEPDGQTVTGGCVEDRPSRVYPWNPHATITLDAIDPVPSLFEGYWVRWNGVHHRYKEIEVRSTQGRFRCSGAEGDFMWQITVADADRG
ncbi:MAG: hypothetical protein ABMB14_29495 [Myxococcota bacterium]